MIKNNSLKRTVFAIVFLLIALPAFILTAYAKTPGKAIGAAIFIIIGSIGLYEVFTLMNMEKLTAILMSTILVAVFFLPWNIGVKTLFIHNEWHSIKGAANLVFNDWRPWVITISYIFIPYLIDSNFRKNNNPLLNLFFLVAVLFVVPTFAKAIWTITIVNIGYTAFFLLIPILSDTLGYFGGMLFGKEMFKGKKLAPKISPKKTWAGFVIGFFFTLIFAIIAGYFTNIWSESGSKITVAILAGMILSGLAPLGDLFFSWIKRSYNKKDFSNLIPGHGGIFDRLDSTAIVFFVGIIFIVLL